MTPGAVVAFVILAPDINVMTYLLTYLCLLLVAGRRIFAVIHRQRSAVRVRPPRQDHTRIGISAIMSPNLLLRRLQRSAGVKDPEDVGKDDAVPEVPPVKENPMHDDDDYYFQCKLLSL